MNVVFDVEGGGNGLSLCSGVPMKQRQYRDERCFLMLKGVVMVCLFVQVYR